MSVNLNIYIRKFTRKTQKVALETNSTLAGVLNLSTGSSLDNSVQLQYMLAKGIYKRSKIRLTRGGIEIFRHKNSLLHSDIS